MKDIFLTAKEVYELRTTKQNIIIFDSSYFLPNTGINAIDEYNNEHIENAVFLILTGFQIQMMIFHICFQLKMFLKHICKNWD